MSQAPVRPSVGGLPEPPRDAPRVRVRVVLLEVALSLLLLAGVVIAGLFFRA